MRKLKNSDIEINQHLWAMNNSELLIVLKTGNDQYEVCGDWECGIPASELELIEVIKKPAGHAATKLCYGFEKD